MDDTWQATLRRLWRRYRRRMRALEVARQDLDDEIEHVLAWDEDITQADIARELVTTRQDIQESVRRQIRRRQRGETS